MTVIYVSCKQTKQVQSDLEKLQEKCSIGVSDPTFNQSATFKAKLTAAFYSNIPVITFEDNRYIIKLMTDPRFVQVIKKLNLTEPVMIKDQMVLKKLLKDGEDVDQLVTFLSQYEKFSTHVQNIQSFRSQMSNIPEYIKTPEDLIAWQKQLKCLNEGFENDLHWDTLLGCFGPFRITPQELLDMGFLKELSKVQAAIRWLGKGINLIKIDGSAADVLNLVNFMFSTTSMKDQTIYQKIDHLLANDFNLPEGATIPDELWIDGELDDDWAFALNYLVGRKVKKTINKLVVQWPGNLAGKAAKLNMTVENLRILLYQNQVRYHKFLSIGYIKDLYIFIDEDADNCDKVIRKF